jgi:cysteine desulfurase
MGIDRELMLKTQNSIHATHSAGSVYMDANATTPLLPEVFEAMKFHLLDSMGNASSPHTHGRRSRLAVEAARQRVAQLLNCRSGEVIFTGGGTESDNLALFGVMNRPGGHLITSSIEHHAVLHAAKKLEQKGIEVTYLPVDGAGRVNPADVSRSIRPHTRLISIMLANNETGVLQPIERIAKIAHGSNVLLHTDAVQAAGKIPIDVERLGCDLLSISAHKMHGPQGVGALYVRGGVTLEPMFYGGSHEFGRRAGTENVAGIAGLGEAASLAEKSFEDGRLNRLARLRDALERGILAEVKDCGVNGTGADRVPNTTSIWFGGVDGSELLTILDAKGVSASGKSACQTGSIDSSHVLSAMGVSPSRANASIRFSLSKQTSEEDVEFAIWQVAEVVEELRVKLR